MHIAEAVLQRRSIRAFRNDPVAIADIREILDRARRAPSGGNLQPWHVHVVTGRTLRDIVTFALHQFDRAPGGDPADHHPCPVALSEPYRGRRREVGRHLYDIVGVDRGDRREKLKHLRRNLEIFGAPAGMFFTIERQMEPLQWTDLGMFVQTIMLLAVERGLATCPQGIWSLFAAAVRQVLTLGETEIVACGMAVGYPDEGAAINTLASERAALDEIAKFYG